MLGIKSFSLLSFYLIYLDVPCRKQYFNCKICTSFLRSGGVLGCVIVRYEDGKMLLPDHVAGLCGLEQTELNVTVLCLGHRCARLFAVLGL